MEDPSADAWEMANVCSESDDSCSQDDSECYSCVMRASRTCFECGRLACGMHAYPKLIFDPAVRTTQASWICGICHSKDYVW